MRQVAHLCDTANPRIRQANWDADGKASGGNDLGEAHTAHGSDAWWRIRGAAEIRQGARKSSEIPEIRRK
jgi:hypothetical protein